MRRPSASEGIHPHEYPPGICGGRRPQKPARPALRLGRSDGPARRRAVHDHRHRDHPLRVLRVHHRDGRRSPRGRWRVEHLEHLHGRDHSVRDRRCPRRHRRLAHPPLVDLPSRGSRGGYRGEHRERPRSRPHVRSPGPPPELRPTQFGALIDKAYALSQMIPVLDAAKADGRVLWLDMENAHTTDDTLWIGERLLERYDRVGICVQANLKRTADDIDRLIQETARIRLVKGAYKETADIAYGTRTEIDRAYLKHLETLFRRARDFAVGSHYGRMIRRALELAREHPTPFEFAMLQGVRDPLKREMVEQGHRVSEYIPYGPNWLPYFSRRLRERPRNIMTMIRSFVED